MCLIIIIIPLFTLGNIYSTNAVTIGFALPRANRGKLSVEGILTAYEKQGGGGGTNSVFCNSLG